jgi:hypothetical protein
MADILDLLGDNSNNKSTQDNKRNRGFLGGLKKSIAVENTDGSLRKSQSSNNFMFDLDNEKKPLAVDQAPDEPIESFGFSKRRTFMVINPNIDARQY